MEAIEDIVAKRAITEVLHFSTNRGLVGILASGAVKSRSRLKADQYLEHVYTPNCAWRKDIQWLDYVSLSISQINAHLFGISSTKWHRDEDVWWCVLSFEPTILSHEGVVFTTTNNIYTSVKHAEGGVGLEAQFAGQIVRWGRNVIERSATLPARFPTCSQAEVLYPGELSTSHLQAIYVVNDLHADIAMAQLSTLGCESVPLLVDPSKFQEHEESG